MSDAAPDWPFEDPPNVAVIAMRQILHEAAPILRVSHDEEDGGWQFLTGGDVSMDDALVVALRRIVAADPSVCELADLPEGWVATRDSPGAPWTRQPAGG